MLASRTNGTARLLIATTDNYRIARPSGRGSTGTRARVRARVFALASSLVSRASRSIIVFNLLLAHRWFVLTRRHGPIDRSERRRRARFSRGRPTAFFGGRRRRGQRVGESVPRRVTRPVNGDWHRALARSLSVCLSVCLSLRAVQWAQSTGIAFLATIQGNQLSVYELVRDGAGVTSETNGIC